MRDIFRWHGIVLSIVKSKLNFPSLSVPSGEHSIRNKGKIGESWGNIA